MKRATPCLACLENGRDPKTCYGARACREYLGQRAWAKRALALFAAGPEPVAVPAAWDEDAKGPRPWHGSVYGGDEKDPDLRPDPEKAAIYASLRTDGRLYKQYRAACAAARERGIA